MSKKWIGMLLAVMLLPGLAVPALGADETEEVPPRAR